MCLKFAQNHVFKGVWDDLEAGTVISIQKKKKLAGSRHFFDGSEIFGIFSPKKSKKSVKKKFNKNRKIDLFDHFIL